MQLNHICITDPFWQTEQELVRKEVLPYQWEALNDRVPGAQKSYAIHNFRAAKALRERSHTPGFQPPVFAGAAFETLPADPDNPDPDKFYGFLFQDSDLYKWIEAASYSLMLHPDAALREAVDGAARLVTDAQAEDGYLDTFYILNGRDQAFTNLRDNHELYCFGHLTEAAVAYYEATGDDTLIGTAERFAAYIDRHIGPEEGKKHGYPGHEVAEMALVRLYRVTGKENALRLARYFIDERGRKPNYFDSEGHPRPAHEGPEEPNSYYQAHKPVRDQDEAKGHAVRAMYLYSGMADIARLTGDESLLAACRRLFDNVTGEKMYITGGVGATRIGEAFSHPFDLPNDTAYAESCAAIGLCFFAKRMLEMEKKAEYADVMERALYNNVLSGIALDGQSFFYVNPLQADPVACRRDARKTHVMPVRQKWFGCACCPPNITRLLSSLGAYVAAEDGNTLYVHLYIGADMEMALGDHKAAVRMTVDQTDPRQWAVNLAVKAGSLPFTLALRIPGWCRGGYRIKGAEGSEITEKDGYLYIRKNWCEEDALTLELDCPVRIMRADTRVREDAGMAAVTHGPFVYCLEEKDNGKDLHLLTLSGNTRPEDASFDHVDIEGRHIPVLCLPGLRERKVTGRGLYFDRDTADDACDEVSLRMIPYFAWANRGENEMQVWVRLRP